MALATDPEPADPRRADDRPRRNGRGRGPRPDRRAPGAAFTPPCSSSATTSGVIRKTCEHIGVLYAGELVEEGPTEEILQNPRHPYTVGLLRCIPRGGTPQGPRQARHDPRASCPRSASTSPAACTSIAAALAQDDLRRPTSPPTQRSGRRTRAAATSTSRRRAAARHERAAPVAESPSTATAMPLPQGRRPDEDVQAGRPRDQGARGRFGRALAGRDARARRRVRERQDDLRADAARDRRADRRERSRSTAGRCRRKLGARSVSGRRRAADRLPEPGLGAQPAPHGAADAEANAREARDMSPAARPRGARSELVERGATARAGALVAADRAVRRDRSSASRSPARSRASRASSCVTSRPRRSTSRSRPRS